MCSTKICKEDSARWRAGLRKNCTEHAAERFMHYKATAQASQPEGQNCHLNNENCSRRGQLFKATKVGTLAAKLEALNPQALRSPISSNNNHHSLQP